MRTILIIVIIVVSLVVIAQAVIKRSTDNTEQHKYTVLKDFGDFEIRQYEPAIFSYVEMPSADYRSTSGNGFRKLAGYIFGGNEENKKIAMTSPVVMSNKDSITTMKFMVPSKMSMDDLPAPKDSSIHFQKEESKVMAAIRFGGWADNDSIHKYTEKLKGYLAENQITPTGTFAFLGYNPPYQMTNRRNEIVVEVEWNAEQ